MTLYTRDISGAGLRTYDPNASSSVPPFSVEDAGTFTRGVTKYWVYINHVSGSVPTLGNTTTTIGGINLTPYTVLGVFAPRYWFSVVIPADISLQHGTQTLSVTVDGVTIDGPDTVLGPPLGQSYVAVGGSPDVASTDSVYYGDSPARLAGGQYVYTSQTSATTAHPAGIAITEITPEGYVILEDVPDEDVTLNGYLIEADGTVNTSNVMTIYVVAQQVQKDFDGQWEVVSATIKDFDARYSIASALEKDTDIRWSILNAETLTIDIDLTWNVVASVFKDTELQWDVGVALENVSKDFDGRWRVVAGTYKDLNLSYYVDSTIFFPDIHGAVQISSQQPVITIN